MVDLQAAIEELYERRADRYGREYIRAFEGLKAGLNEGHIRAAEPDPSSPSGWRVNAWVKKGILLGFRIGRVVEFVSDPSPVRLRRPRSPQGKGSASKANAGGAVRQFRDKHTFPLKQIPASHNVRVVPGGSSIRDGCYMGRDVVCMPPMFVNVGAYVDDGTLIDSHALVGSCAQVGKRCHISAGA